MNPQPIAFPTRTDDELRQWRDSVDDDGQDTYAEERARQFAAMLPAPPPLHTLPLRTVHSGPRKVLPDWLVIAALLGVVAATILIGSRL